MKKTWRKQAAMVLAFSLAACIMSVKYVNGGVYSHIAAAAEMNESDVHELSGGNVR